MKKKLMSSAKCKRRLDILAKNPELDEEDHLYIENIDYEPLLSEEEMFFNEADMDWIKAEFLEKNVD